MNEKKCFVCAEKKISIDIFKHVISGLRINYNTKILGKTSRKCPLVNGKQRVVIAPVYIPIPAVRSVGGWLLVGVI